MVVAIIAFTAAGLTTLAGAPALGQWWFENSPESLNLTQAVVQRYLHPNLWDMVAVPVLLSPIPRICLISGIVFAGLSFFLLALHAWRFGRS
ncbi:MAG: hypothetical protein ACFB6S_04665 [Geminicoccaceae bacterium]